MKKIFFTLLLGTALLCQAEAKNPPLRHQFRLGWGDMLFETFASFSCFGRVTVKMPFSTRAEILSFTTSSGSE